MIEKKTKTKKREKMGGAPVHVFQLSERVDSSTRRKVLKQNEIPGNLLTPQSPRSHTNSSSPCSQSISLRGLSG